MRWRALTFPPRHLAENGPAGWERERKQEEEGQGTALRNSSSTRVVNTRPWIFQISAWRRIFWEIFGMVVQCMEDKRTAPLTCNFQWICESTDLWWYMWGCVHSEAAQRKHKGTSFTRVYEVLWRTHQTPEQTPSQSAFSAFFRCPHNCIFEDSAGHNGPDRARNTNLSALSSETMWSQPILIELLAVLLLLQTHMHFPFRNLSSFALRTCLNSSWGHFHFTAQNVH